MALAKWIAASGDENESSTELLNFAHAQSFFSAISTGRTQNAVTAELLGNRTLGTELLPHTTRLAPDTFECFLAKSLSTHSTFLVTSLLVHR